MRGRRFLFTFIIFLGFYSIQAQEGLFVSSRIENGKIVVKIDFRWDEQQRKEVQKLFNFDSTLWINLSSNTTKLILENESWDVTHLNAFEYELSKDLETIPAMHLDIDDVFLLDADWQVAPGYVDQEKIVFGANRFRKPGCFSYIDRRAIFCLPAYPNAGKVFIAGSFNSWNPARTEMHKTDSGWVAEIELNPGKYFYKFVVDGNWVRDSNNELSENDGQGNINSAVFCPNFEFHLAGYWEARRVFVAGTFNLWDPRDLKMQKYSEGWRLPVYLKDGTYSYKFIVDDRWITDPENPQTRTDSRGNINSVMGRGEDHVFFLKGFTDANSVYLAGNFNNWDEGEIAMDRTPDGWKVEYKLARGNYEYKFITDGRWIPDPENIFTTGKGEYINSFLAFKSNYTFILQGYPDAKEIRITGSFNNWTNEGYLMVKREGFWEFPVYLGKGKHLYKFIIDGEWILDPGNRLWEENEYGTGNSILWIP